jgi:hypothetical protein
MTEAGSSPGGVMTEEDLGVAGWEAAAGIGVWLKSIGRAKAQIRQALSYPAGTYYGMAFCALGDGSRLTLR